MIVAFGYMPSGREAPPAARSRGLLAEKVLREIGPKIAAMDLVLAPCEEDLGPRRRLLDPPILGLLRAAQWRKFHLVHGLDPVKQIQPMPEETIEK
jgi:hypothetical protein